MGTKVLGRALRSLMHWVWYVMSSGIVWRICEGESGGRTWRVVEVSASMACNLKLKHRDGLGAPRRFIDISWNLVLNMDT